MKSFSSLLLAFIFSIPVIAQDAKAKAILDELSKKNKALTTIKAVFTYEMANKDQKVNEKQEGSIAIKGSKYKLNIAGQEVISDGKSVWTYLKDANEVQINNAADQAAEKGISPSNIFTIYEKGFKYKFDGEKVEGGKTMQIITLNPADPKGKNYHTIKLFIDKTAKQISSLKVMGKDGTVHTYSIKSFTGNGPMDDKMFTFNASAHPKVEVIDLREN